MSILIKGMKMPKERPVFAVVQPDGACFYASEDGKAAYFTENGRAIETPPRLANIDVLIDRIRKNMDLFGNDYLTSLAAVENFLCHAPLVIDEEEDNEHTD